MTVTAFVFFVLKWVEFLVLFISGKALETTKTRKDYWRIAVVPIIIFALVEGLRWGRLIDWNNAVVEYNELSSFITESQISNPLYTIILYTLKCLGFSYPFFVVLQCGFLMYSALFLLQDYKKYSRWILPCLIIAFINNENFIRFYFAQSFLFIAIYYYLHHSLKKFFLFSVLTGLTHFAQIPILLVILFSKYLNNWQFPRIVGIVLLLGAIFIADISQMTFLVIASDYVVSLFGMGSEYALLSRLNSMSDIISGTAFGTEGRLFVASIFNKIGNALIYIPVIWMAPSCIKKDKFANLIYNMTVLNIIITPVLGQAELLHRFPMSFNIFVVMSFAAVVANNIHRNKTCLLVFMMLFFYFYSFLNAPFVREDYMMYFLWDSNGAATNYAPYN